MDTIATLIGILVTYYWYLFSESCLNFCTTNDRMDITLGRWTDLVLSYTDDLLMKTLLTSTQKKDDTF
jgi:hypothetical protein